MSENPKSYAYLDVNGAGVQRRKVAIIGAGPVSGYLEKKFRRDNCLIFPLSPTD